MGFEQYHEPADEVPEATRTFARLCASLTEEAEAIGWYEQRLALERDPDAKAIMRDAQGEEFKHFAMNLEFLTRRTPKWRAVLREVIGKFLSKLILGIGYLLVAVDSRKQGLHDKIADTYVIKI